MGRIMHRTSRAPTGVAGVRLPGLLPIYSRLFHLGLCQTQGKPETDRRETYALKNTQEEGVIPKERSSCLCSSPLWQRSSGPSCGLPAVTSAGQPRAPAGQRVDRGEKWLYFSYTLEVVEEFGCSAWSAV